MAGTDHPAGENPDVRHERWDVPPRVIGWMIAGTSVLVLAAVVGCGLLVRYWLAREARDKASALPLAAQERERVGGLPTDEALRAHFGGQPPLEGLPVQQPRPDTAGDQAAAERRRLEGYGWVDESKKIVHVPLERARELALKDRQKYLPSRPAKGEKR